MRPYLWLWLYLELRAHQRRRRAAAAPEVHLYKDRSGPPLHAAACWCWQATA